MSLQEIARQEHVASELQSAWDSLLLAGAAITIGVGAADLLPKLIEIDLELRRMSENFESVFKHLDGLRVVLAGMALSAMIEQCGKLILALTPETGIEA